MRSAQAAVRVARARAELGPLPRQIVALDAMTMRELRDRWAEVFGYATASHNHAYLRKKIGWRLQELAEGGLTARARERIAELAPRAPIRHRAPPSPIALGTSERARDPRLPPAATVLRRAHGGVEHEVVVLEEGFGYRGTHYSSLSAVAKAITGTGWNGLLFFGLVERRGQKVAK